MKKATPPRMKRIPKKLRDVLKRAWQDYEKHGGVPHEQFWKELAKMADKRFIRSKGEANHG